MFDRESLKKATRPLPRLIANAVESAKKNHITRILINEGDEERVRQMLLDAIWSTPTAHIQHTLDQIYIGTVPATPLRVGDEPVTSPTFTFVKASKFMVSEVELAAASSAARVRRMTEEACRLAPEKWPSTSDARDALHYAIEVLAAKKLTIPKELLDEGVLEVPKKTRSSSDIFHDNGFPATVLKGVVENDNGTAYFASLGGYLIHRRVAEQFGWITVTNEVEEATDFGHEVYKNAHLDALSRKGRAYLWDWTVIDAAALVKDTK